MQIADWVCSLAEGVEECPLLSWQDDCCGVMHQNTLWEHQAAVKEVVNRVLDDHVHHQWPCGVQFHSAGG